MCFLAECKTLIQRVGGSTEGSARLKLQSDMDTAPEIRICFQQELSEVEQAAMPIHPHAVPCAQPGGLEHRCPLGMEECNVYCTNITGPDAGAV